MASPQVGLHSKVPGTTDALAALNAASDAVNARGLGRSRTYSARLAPLIAKLEQAGALDGWDDPPPRQPEPPQR
jgi:hypothetical protein